MITKRVNTLVHFKKICQKMGRLASIIDLIVGLVTLIMRPSTKQHCNGCYVSKITLLSFEYLGRFREIIFVCCCFQIADQILERPSLSQSRGTATNSLLGRDCRKSCFLMCPKTTKKWLVCNHIDLYLCPSLEGKHHNISSVSVS